MLRRMASLSSRISSQFNTIFSKSLSLHLHHLHRQVPAGLKFAELLMTESAKMAKEGDTSNQVRPFITFVLGGPGSGKGTQCAKIAETFGFVHLSAGELLRKEISSGCENGAVILDIIKEGKIVPSEITVNLIWKAIELSKSRKMLIDGFPRSNENRIAFENMIGVEPDLVVFFDCPEEEMVKRLLSRNQGRVDDNLETIRERLKVFDMLNLPVINYYSSKGIVHKIKAVGTMEEVFEKVYPIFASLRHALEGILSYCIGCTLLGCGSILQSLLGSCRETTLCPPCTTWPRQELFSPMQGRAAFVAHANQATALNNAAVHKCGTSQHMGDEEFDRAKAG